LNQAATFALFVSRANEPKIRPLYVFYASIVGDYDRVVTHFLHEQRYAEAILHINNAPMEKGS
jgi:hypothetical protein